MIGVVIGHQKGFAQQCLAVTPGNGSEEIAAWIAHKLADCIQVGKKLLDTSAPGLCIFRRVAGWPMLFRPFGRNMLSV